MFEVQFSEDYTEDGNIIFKVPMVDTVSCEVQNMYGVISMDTAIKAESDTFDIMRDYMLDDLMELVVMHCDNGYVFNPL